MAHDVFVSHSARDRETADAVCATLEANRIRCWVAPRDILLGARWADAIVDAINESRLMVLVFSSHSNHSDQVMSEVEVAVNKGIPIIPLKMEDVPLTRFMQYHIANRHWLDALTPPLERHLQRLAEAVKVLLAPVEERGEALGEGRPAEPAPGAPRGTTGGPGAPTPARKALELGVVLKWGGRPIVRLAAVFLTLAAVVAPILVLVGWPVGGDDDVMVALPTTLPLPGTPARTPATSPLPANTARLQSGTWSGITSQGKGVEFDVIEGGAAIIRIGIDVEGECPLPTGGTGPQPTGCTCEVKTETKMTKPWPIAEAGFSYAPGDFEFSAVFDSSTTAHGFVRVHSPGTAGQAACSSDQVTWTASPQ